MEAVIGIRDAGKTKSLRTRTVFILNQCKTTSAYDSASTSWTLEHLFIQKSDSGTRGPDDGPRSHQTLYSTSEKNALELEIADRAALPRISRCSRRDRAGNKTGWEHEVSVCYALGRSVCAQRHRVLPACFALELEASESLTEAQRRWCWGRSKISELFRKSQGF